MSMSIPLENLKKHYKVEETGNPRSPYRLTGKRGAVYLLMRQVKKGVLKTDGPMYAVDAQTGVIRRLARYQTEWVRD